MICVYKIKCLKNDKIYIGSTVDFCIRKSAHLHYLRNNNHHSPVLQNSFNKYGEENFLFEIMEEVINDKEILLEREQYWIDTLKPEFNCSPTAGSPLGVKHTIEAKSNMSKAHEGHNLEGHVSNCKCTICDRKVGTEHPRYKKREERYCECGCGKAFICMFDSDRRFFSGHNKSQLGRKKTAEEIEKQRASLKRYYRLKNKHK